MISTPGISASASGTGQQATQLLHVSSQSIESGQAAGRLPSAIRSARRWLWRKDDIRRHLEGLRTAAEAAAS
jgi:hypothetical protein